MVRDFHVADEKGIGYYVGFITSCFALSQLLTGIDDDAIYIYCIPTYYRHSLGYALGQDREKTGYFAGSSRHDHKYPTLWIIEIIHLGISLSKSLWPAGKVLQELVFRYMY